MESPSLLEMTTMGFDTSLMDSTSTFGVRKTSKTNIFKKKLKCLNLAILWSLILVSIIFNLIVYRKIFINSTSLDVIPRSSLIKSGKKLDLIQNQDNIESRHQIMDSKYINSVFKLVNNSNELFINLENRLDLLLVYVYQNLSLEVFEYHNKLNNLKSEFKLHSIYLESIIQNNLKKLETVKRDFLQMSNSLNITVFDQLSEFQALFESKQKAIDVALSNKEASSEWYQLAVGQLGKEIDELLNKTVPNGYIYIQYPKQPEPNQIWKWAKWKEISNLYKGHFFRVVSDPFSFGVEQKDAFQGHWHSLNCPSRFFFKRDDVCAQNIQVRDSSSDLIHGQPRLANETRPINYSIRVWMRTLQLLNWNAIGKKFSANYSYQKVVDSK